MTTVLPVARRRAQPSKKNEGREVSPLTSFLRAEQETENGMKRISLIGVLLGVVLGLVVGLLSGSWILWLGLGLVIGAVIGSASARRSLLENSNVGGALKP